MSPALKGHLPVIILMAVLGIFSSVFFMTLVHDNAGAFNASIFNLLLTAIPCVAMVICSFIVAITAKEIGSRMLWIVTGICVIAGFASMVVVAGWQGDSEIVSAVLANSPSDTTITPITNSPFGIVRNVLLYVVCPMVGCVLGAWIGSRIHPLSVDRNNNPSKKKSATKKH